MIFIPSYFDFVSVRNLLMKKEVDFVSVTEYARVSEVSRGRARFLQGSKPLLLYTGRAHFFSRHMIKGVRHLIVYGLPEHSEFYPELVNMLNAGLDRDNDMEAPMSCLTVFTKFDALALERIVGNEHCNRMIKGEKSSYMFCS
jgi:U3 small nucleolar RNA-associated protein 25